MRERLFGILDADDSVLVLPTQRSVRDLLVDYARSRRTSVSAERAVSFDEFSALFDVAVPEGRRADGLSRALFASTYLDDYPDALGYLYNPAFPDSRERFVSFIASTLPSLGATMPHFNDMTLYRDVMRLKEAYTQFMARYGLYEPSWIEKSGAAFRGDRSKTWYLVCPSCEVNMLRLVDQIGQCDFMKCIEAEGSSPVRMRLYDNERAELEAVFLRLEELRREGVDMGDIILSTPDVERLRGYLELEAARRDIPLSFENDGPVSRTKVGRFLTSIAQLERTRYDFPVMERLLLDSSLPYTEEIATMNRALVKAMCAAGLVDDSAHDLASRLPRKEGDHLRRIQKHVAAIVSARRSGRLMSSLQGLATYLFGERQFRDDESDSEVYSFIMDAFSSFSGIVDLFEDGVDGLFSLFVDTLSRTEYVSQHRRDGIRVFSYSHDYQIAARHRFIFALGDENTRVEYRDYAFLEDGEVEGRRVYSSSDALLDCYRLLEGDVWMSGSQQTYAGQSMAPFHLSSQGLVDPCEADDMPTGHLESELRSAAVARRFMPQAAGRSLTGAMRTGPFIPEKGLSYSMVSTYARCPFSSAARNLMHLEAGTWSPQEYDPMQAGIFLHSVIERFLQAHLKKPLLSCDLDSYASEIAGIFDQEISGYGFSTYVRRFLRSTCLEGLQDIPRLLLERYEGILMVEAVEKPVAAAGMNGRMDAVFSSGDDTILVDFKTNAPPDDRRYQLLMYRMMMQEEGEVVDASNLIYYCIRRREDAGHLVNEIPLSRSSGKADEAKLEARLELLESDIKATLEGFGKGEWMTTDDFGGCTHCDVRPLCRRRFVTA